MHRRFHTPLIMLTGLCAAQIIGTWHVHMSNAGLLKTVEAVKGAGYLAVPNSHVEPLLKTLETAFMGGLFFTLSIGAGATLLTLVSVWVWKYICRKNRYLAAPFVLPWIFFLIGINAGGVSILPSLYCTIVPLVTAIFALKLTPDRLSRTGWVRGALHAGVIMVLALVWAFQSGGSMFINIRDNLLLTNTIGTKINDFYYRYTLYPAEAFKSLNQKMIKTCRIQVSDNQPLREKLTTRFVRRNYLVVETADSVDLSVVETDGLLQLKQKDRVIIQTSLKKFMDRPGPILKSFSRKCDRHLFFRQLTFVSLLTAFPIVLYFFVHALLLRAAGFFLKPASAAAAAGLICLVMGSLMTLPVYAGSTAAVTADRIPELLDSDSWRDQTIALKAIAEKKQTWVFSPEAAALESSPRIPVRYWLARALAHSKSEPAVAALTRLMDDPQPIVSCQALYGLGQSRNKQMTNVILDKIDRSDHWYVQWYAYNALRNLGWRQQKISI